MKRWQIIGAAVLTAGAGTGIYVATRHPGGRPGELPTGVTPSAGEDAPPAGCYLTDVTRQAGIEFIHHSGARGELLNPETFGPGACWVDHDGDGWIDLLFINGNELRGDPDASVLSRLYRNLGDGSFEDVTRQAGLTVPFYGMGATAADIDNDGDQDLFIYGLHRSVLFLNEGGGRFRDATREAGLEGITGWVCAVTFLDYNRDGWLDLYVGNYVRWRPEVEEGLDCNFGGGEKKYCPVAHFDPSPPQLFRGLGGGRFEETTVAAGLARLKGKTLGVAVEDYDRDGWPDIFAANDSVPNFLLRNRGDGSFEDRGIESGFATDAQGAALAGMGIDTAWAPEDGPLWVAVGNFSGEPTTLHVQEQGAYFVERSFAMGIAESTLGMVTFGLLLQDHDLDGRLDLALANGHVFDVEQITHVPYRQPAQIFLGRDGGRFARVAPEDPNHILRRPLLGRGLACADYDKDGDLDLALTENQGPAHLLRNDLEGPRRYIRIELQGTRSSRDAFGAEVTLRSRRAGASGAPVVWSVRRTKKSSSSYLSQSEPPLTFGLATGEEPISVEVRWPAASSRGALEAFPPPSVGRITLLVEGGGEVSVDEVGTAAAGRPAGADSQSSIAARQRGQELLSARRFVEAAAALEAAVALDPHDFVAQRLHIIALAQAGRREALEARLTEIPRVFPSANLLVSHFAQVLAEQRQPALAERLYLEASKIDPARVDIWLALGGLAYDRRDFDAALTAYQRAIELKPDAVVALANIGKIHTLRREWARANESLERALAVLPSYAPALSTLGGVLLERGDLEQAEEKILAAIQSSPSRDRSTLLEAHGNLGILYLKRRDRERAIAAFEKVLEIDPADPQARALLERLRRK